MTVPDLDLNRTFFCHSHAPFFGFWGEIRRMVREDMTLLEAVRFHNRNFDFKFQDGYVPLTHELPHQLLAIVAVYNPRFRFLLPQINPKTGFLEPNGYNGFSDGEDFVTSIEHGLLKAIIYQKFQEPDLSKATFMAQIERIAATQPQPHKMELAAWVLADLEDQATRIHDIKKRYGYDFHDLRMTLKEIPKSERPKTRFNRHGEARPLQRAFDPEDYRSLYDSVIHAINYLNHRYLEEDKTVDDLEQVWGNIKIRDLHLLIGGTEAAAEFFKKCGVMGNKKAADLTAAL